MIIGMKRHIIHIWKFNLDENKKVKELSEGMKVKFNLVVALSHNAELLILDEPTSGLDPVSRDEILQIFKKLARHGVSILFSTHITSDLEHVADKIIFIDNGRVYLDEYRDDIFDNYGVLKCDIDQFNQIDKKDIVSYIKNRYFYHLYSS